jgi:hypothetical protein
MGPLENPVMFSTVFPIKTIVALPALVIVAYGLALVPFPVKSDPVPEIALTNFVFASVSSTLVIG